MDRPIPQPSLIIFLSLVFVIALFANATAKEPNNNLSTVFLQGIINKYGLNGHLTPVQLEDFLSSLDARPIATDVDINHAKNCANTPCSEEEILSECYSGDELISLHTTAELGLQLESSDLASLCPAILYQASSQVCSQTATSCNDTTIVSSTLEPGQHSTAPTKAEMWGYGFLFVSIINACSMTGVFVVPLMNKRVYRLLLTYLIGLAVGTLSSSALLQLIPEAHGLILSKEEVWKNATIIGGIYLFFIVEKILNFISESKKSKQELQIYRKDKEEGELHQTGPINQTSEHPLSSSITNENAIKESHSSTALVENEMVEYNNDQKEKNSTDKINYCHQEENGTSLENLHNKDKSLHENCHHIDINDKPTIQSIAWMIIFGDGLHNFIDGLSIGASFSISIMAGISICVAVFCEEFPHELGDFAILLQAGMKPRHALMYNFLSSCLCYLGLIVGIVLGELTSSSEWIFAVAGGMFLYISLADMLPQLNHNIKEMEQGAMKFNKWLIFLLQCFGLFTGLGIMLCLALLGERIQI